MRTTMDIDDSVLDAVTELAHRQRKTAGEVMSTLARQALTQWPVQQGAGDVREPPAAHGFRPFPTGDALVTNAAIDRLRDGLGV